MPRAEAWAIAVEFFGRWQSRAHAAGTTVVMEANPPEYGADFVTRAGEAIELVQAVNHPGFRLHLDTGCMTLARRPDPRDVRRRVPAAAATSTSASRTSTRRARPGRVDHAAFAAELAGRGYAGWVSLEMREPKPFTLDGLAAAVRWVQERYAPPTQARGGPRDDADRIATFGCSRSPPRSLRVAAAGDGSFRRSGCSSGPARRC